jgi:hypothetical protein
MRHIATAMETDRSIGQVSAVGCVALFQRTFELGRESGASKGTTHLTHYHLAPAPSLSLGITRLSLDLLHGSKDSAHLDPGFEFDRHSVRIVGEPD